MIPYANFDMGFMDFARLLILRATLILWVSGCSIPQERCCYELIDGSGYEHCRETANASCELGKY